MDPELAAALQKSDRLSREVLLLRDAIDRSNEALEQAIKIKDERDRFKTEYMSARQREREQTELALQATDELKRYKNLAAVVMKVWNCSCNHNRADRTFTCNCCLIRYEFEDLGLVGKPQGLCSRCRNKPATFFRMPQEDWNVCADCRELEKKEEGLL